MKGYTNVQADMQWIRRCKQEEVTLIDNFEDDDEEMERQRLYQQYAKKQAYAHAQASKKSSIREEVKN